MRYCDIAIIGSGMGGSLSALATPKDKSVIVFEKDSNLGGCGGVFKRYGNYYNIGATTLVGYENGHPLKELLDARGVTLDLKASPIAFRVLQKGKHLDRYQNFKSFLQALDSTFPHKNNYKFWKKIKDMDEAFWNLKGVYFAKYSLRRYWHTLVFALKALRIFGFDIFRSADSYIKKTLPHIEKEYQDFLDAGLLITVQKSSKNLPLLFMALGLAYPFHPVFYPKGGMGRVFEKLLEGFEVHKQEAITSIEKKETGYLLTSKKGKYFAKQLILNSTLYDSAKLFENRKIKKYYEGFEASDQSAFVVYMSLKTSQELLNHYQVILEKNLPYSFSKSFFVSFSEKDDTHLGAPNLRSVTISTHTKVSFWESLSQEQYKKAKKRLQEYIVEEFLANFDTISKEQITKVFSATPKTFSKYIGRSNCGGTPIGFHNIHKLGSCTTPFTNLFHTGDTVFAGQGWPGVALGVQVLKKELNAKSRT